MKRSRRFLLLFLYACATLQFVRFYVTKTEFYLNLPAYLAGRERQPFQERILPALLMRWFYRSPLLHYAAGHTKGAFTPDRAPFFLISLFAIVAAGYFAQRLYRLVSTTGLFAPLVYPIFLFTMMWTYSVHTEADFSYPYDMLAVAFFTAGLVFIYSRRYAPLLLTVAVGTFNRETTLFLIGTYLLDAASDSLPHRWNLEQVRSSLGKLPWARTALLCAVWLAIKMTLAHRFMQNSNAENYVRLRNNVASLQPRLWPALLNICGYMMPVVLLWNRSIQNERFRSYLWILPLWLGIMFYTGVLVETRIYGELCSYVAVALVLILEQHAAVFYSRAVVNQHEGSAESCIAA